MNSETKSSRRRFVKMLTFGTAAATLPGGPWRGTLLADIQPAAPPDIGLLRVKLSDYPPLQHDFGSVRLGITPMAGNFDPLGSFYPIIISRAGAALFHALDSACRHAGCVVSPFDATEGNIFCGCHGSTYAIDGRVLGGPTVSPLFRYALSFDGVDTLTIEVPFLGYRVTSSTVQNGDAPRFQLDFPTLAYVEYEVRFRQNVRDAWAVAPFSLTLAGAAEHMSLVGDDLPATVFVDRPTPTGFFTVAVKILDLTEGCGC